MKRLALTSLIALACLFGASTVRADLTIEMKQNGTPQQLLLKAHMFATSVPKGAVIFRGDRHVFWALDTGDKSYTEVTEADAREMGGQVDAAMAQMKEQMKGMPPEQRAMVEKMMADRMPKKQNDGRVIKATGERKVIDGFACAGYLATRGDNSTTEIWAADAAAVGIDPAELVVLAEFTDFFKSMLGAVGLDAMRDLAKDFAHPGPQDVPGFPVLTISRDAGGKETGRAELVSVGHGEIAADKFEIPAGFKKTKSQDKGPGRKD